MTITYELRAYENDWLFAYRALRALAAHPPRSCQTLLELRLRTIPAAICFWRSYAHGAGSWIHKFWGERCLSANKVVTVNVNHFIYFHSRSHISWERTEGKKRHVIFLFLFSFLAKCHESSFCKSFAIPRFNTLSFFFLSSVSTTLILFS